MRAHRRVRIAAIIGGAALFAAAATAVLVVARSLPPRVCELPIEPEPEPEHVPVAPAMSVAQSTPITTAPLPVPAPPADVGFVFLAGRHTYVSLDEVIELPKHGRPRILEDTYPVTIAIAEVARRDVPASLAAWLRHGAKIDGNWHVRVTGFVVIARVRGSPPDASEDLSVWTAQSVMEHGRPMLAARVDGAPGTFARRADLPEIELFSQGGEALIDDARERVLASSPVADVQQRWQAGSLDGFWYEANDARFDARTFVHPRTGVVWVVIHVVRPQECDVIGGNVLGLYRMGEAGELIEVQLRGAGLEELDQLIDLDRDGEPELLSTGSYRADIWRANGDSVLSINVPEYDLGCGC
ncbi:MAG TPA: hypothetical protein VIV11_15105 [Kofleriaceae bacterium]